MITDTEIKLKGIHLVSQYPGDVIKNRTFAKNLNKL